MKQEEIEKTTAICNRQLEILQGLEENMFEWADTDEGLFEDFYEELEEHRDFIEDMPEKWVIACSEEFTAGKIFTEPATLKLFLNEKRNLLNRAEKQLIRNFLGNPWFYSVFSVEESIGKNFLRIYDYSIKSTVLLYSKSVRQYHRYGDRLYLCLLFNNGECLQTYGTINYFRGFSVRDMEFFAGFVSHHFDRTGDFSYAIYQNPLPFLLLSGYAELPVSVFRGEMGEFCYHSEKVNGFSPADLTKEFEIDEKENIVQFTYKGSFEPDFFHGMYYEKKNKILHVHALGISYYKSLVNLLKNRYHFPEEPSWRVGT